MKIISRFLFVAFLVCFVFSVSAQNKRPKVGLVLSGGGAKGAAHIGVLKAMEEAGLTPDYITGTSMGSIMGGLYSIGYSADELQELVEAINWDDILTNKVSLDKVTFEEKYYYGRYLLDFYLKDKKFKFPSGVIEGQALMELFSEVTRPVHHITDFNDFPIPYACVAADIVKGEPVVLNKGSLAMAMRASMAIPTVFTPVKIDGKLLVDGGLVRNVPVQEVIDMGADIVIAVYVGTNLGNEEDLTSLISILTQSAFLTSARDAEEQFKNVDILIKPDLQGYTTSSFNNAKEIVELGMKSGEQYVEIFRDLADSLKKIGHLHEVIKPEIQDKYTFERIEIEGNKVITDDFILGKFKFKPGDELTIDEIHMKVEMTYGTQYFERVSYQILGEPGKRILKLQVVERPNIHFKFSYFYDSENKGGIIANATFRNVVLNSSRLIFETSLSSQPKILADYFKYMGKKQNYAAVLTGTYIISELPAYNDDGKRVSIYNSDYISGSVKLQSTNLRNSTYGIELKASNIILKPTINELVSQWELDPDISISLSRIKYSNLNFGLFYRFNNLNDRYFPTRGVSIDMEAGLTTNTKGTVNGIIKIDSVEIDYELNSDEFEGLVETNTIRALSMDIKPVIPLSRKLAILSKAKLKLSSIADSMWNVTEYDYIGGFRPGLVNSTEFFGAGVKEYDLANYFYGRLGLQYEILRNVYVQADFNVVTTEFPVTFLYPNASTGVLAGRKTRIGYGGAIGMKSPIGPLSFAFAKDHHREGWKASLIIGFHY